LALGSGGLRGIAHIGVLRGLENEKIPVYCIAGSSIGSLVGALFASGMDVDTMYKLAKSLKRRHWLDFVIPHMGVVGGERTLDMLRILTKCKHFNEMDIPLAVVATDLIQGKEVVYRDGPVAEAVRGSISVPGIFVPYRLGDRLLVDGAVLNPTPSDVVRSMGADIVIAVDLLPANPVGEVSNMFDVIIQSIDIMEKELLKKRLQCCDVFIRPDVGHISPSSFSAVDECMALGEAAITAALPEIRRLLLRGDTERNDESLNLRAAISD